MNFLLKKSVQQTRLQALQLKAVLNARSNLLFFEIMLTHQNFQKINLLEEKYHKTFLLQKILLVLQQIKNLVLHNQLLQLNLILYQTLTHPLSLILYREE